MQQSCTTSRAAIGRASSTPGCCGTQPITPPAYVPLRAREPADAGWCRKGGAGRDEFEERRLAAAVGTDHPDARRARRAARCRRRCSRPRVVKQTWSTSTAATQVGGLGVGNRAVVTVGRAVMAEKVPHSRGRGERASPCNAKVGLHELDIITAPQGSSVRTRAPAALRDAVVAATELRLDKDDQRRPGGDATGVRRALIAISGLPSESVAFGVQVASGAVLNPYRAASRE